MKIVLSIIILLTVVTSNAFAQEEYRDDINDFVVSEMRLWLKNDIVIKALAKQNEKHALFSPTDKKILNETWHGERRKNKRPLMDKVLENDVSKFLRMQKEDAKGLFTEIVIIDAYGINLGQTSISTDYWQVDSEKWKNTLGTRSYGTYVSELSFDYDTELFQVEVAFIASLNDEPVGVIYAGVDVEQLEEWKKRLFE